MLSNQRSDDSFAGEPFTGSPANEGHNIMVNEAAAARLDFTPQSIVGKTIIYTGSYVTMVTVHNFVPIMRPYPQARRTAVLTGPIALRQCC